MNPPISCRPGTANCDGNPANGCETNVLASINNCGSCGTVCTVANGTPTCSTGICAIASCNSGYTPYQGGCIATVVNCAVANGSGTQTWDPTTSRYGPCSASACGAGYVVSNGACIPQVLPCSVQNGTGTQTWDGTAYGTCTATSCDAAYVLASNACIAEVTNCTVVNGGGTQTWDPTTNAYGACTATACDSGYTVVDGACASAYQWQLVSSSACEARSTETGLWHPKTCDATTIGQYIEVANPPPTNPTPDGLGSGAVPGSAWGFLVDWEDASGFHSLVNGQWNVDPTVSCAGGVPIYVCAGPSVASPPSVTYGWKLLSTQVCGWSYYTAGGPTPCVGDPGVCTASKGCDATTAGGVVVARQAPANPTVDGTAQGWVASWINTDGFNAQQQDGTWVHDATTTQSCPLNSYGSAYQCTAQ